jgi:hypothetical protein
MTDQTGNEWTPEQQQAWDVAAASLMPKLNASVPMSSRTKA